MERLRAACHELEQVPKPRHARLKGVKHARAYWELIDKVLPAYCPLWYRELTCEYDISGLLFECPLVYDANECYLLGPDLIYELIEYGMQDFYRDGVFAVVDSNDGNNFVMDQAANFNDPVYFFEHSGTIHSPIHACVDNCTVEETGKTFVELLEYLVAHPSCYEAWL